ncbi:hypothetical protein H4582DRAFT_2129634 [Lactarius indigo]|nr:hypothetical protein H4582DRAFT_2129634 [Lactarius indigo]
MLAIFTTSTIELPVVSAPFLLATLALVQAANELQMEMLNNGNAALVSERLMVWPALSARLDVYLREMNKGILKERATSPAIKCLYRHQRMDHRSAQASLCGRKLASRIEDSKIRMQERKAQNTDESSSEAQPCESEAVRRDGKCRRRQVSMFFTGSAFCILCKKNASWCENPGEEVTRIQKIQRQAGSLLAMQWGERTDKFLSFQSTMKVNLQTPVETKMGHKDSGGKDARCDDPLQNPSAISKSRDSEETAKKLRGRQRSCMLARQHISIELPSPPNEKETYAVCLNAVPKPSANQRRLVDAEQTWNDGSEFVVNINRTKAQMMDLKDQARSSPEVGPDADGDC